MNLALCLNAVSLFIFIKVGAAQMIERDATIGRSRERLKVSESDESE